MTRRLRPLTPIFDIDTSRGTIAVGNTPGVEPIPVFAAAGTANTATGTNSITLALPGGWAAGQTAIACLARLDNVDSSYLYSASGWANIGHITIAASVRIYILSRTLQIGDSNPTFVHTSSGAHAGFILTYTGVNAITPAWQFVKTTGDQYSAQPTSQSTPTDNLLVLSMAAVDFYQPLAIGTPRGFTQRGIINLASQGGLIVAELAVPTAGTVDFPTYTGPQYSGWYFVHYGVTVGG